MDTETVTLSSDDEVDKEPKLSETKDIKRNGRNLENPEHEPPSKKIKVDTDVNKNTENAKNEDILEEAVNFKEFLNICMKLDDSPEMKKIVELKLRRYYHKLNPHYKKSDDLSTLLERKSAELERSPRHIFMHIKEVVDEFLLHRVDKTIQTQTSNRMVRKLCRAVELLQRKIKKLEQKEVDWSDDEDSSYIQLQRFRERLVKVYKKLRELEGEESNVFRKRISFSGTQFPSVNRAIERFVNTRGIFPDFKDVLDLLKASFTKENISITHQQLHTQAKQAFQNIGEQLQKQRMFECWDAHRVFLQEDNDPADDSPELQTLLEKNKEEYKIRIDKIINEYAEKTKSTASGEDSNHSEGHNSVKDEKTDDDDDDDDEDEDDEDEFSKNETADDILDIIEKEAPTDELDDSCEPLVQYCGPVSPPQDNDVKQKEKTSEVKEAENVLEHEEIANDSVVLMENDLESLQKEAVSETQDNKSTPAKIKDTNKDAQDENKSQENKPIEINDEKDNTNSIKMETDPKDMENTVKSDLSVQKETKTFLKVKPLASLQNKPTKTISDDDIILLD